MERVLGDRAAYFPRERTVHDIAILALDGVVLFDLGIACEVFGHVRLAGGEPAYRVRVCGEGRRVRTRAFDLDVPHGLDRVAAADTVVVPGVENLGAAIAEPVLEAVRAAWRNGARLASICTGAFVLAETGLLDDRRATTHWLATDEFRRRFPRVALDPQVLFVDGGRIVTSAGALAGMDMCLHLVGRDHGQAVAAHAARLAVAPLHRDGGQAQFIRHDLPRAGDSLAPLLDWMLAHLDRPLVVDALASRANTSPRTFARRFRQQTGTTPLQWLLTARIRRAQEMLETGSQTIDAVAAAVGFEAPVSFRARFQQVVGISPQAYRRRFHDADARTVRTSRRRHRRSTASGRREGVDGRRPRDP